MERLQVRIAQISVVTVDVVHLNPVIMLEEQPTVATLTPLHFEQPGQFRTDRWMPSLSSAPVHPIAVIRTAIALDFDMPRNRHVAVSPKARRFRVGRRGRKGQACAQPMPVAPGDPAD